MDRMLSLRDIECIPHHLYPLMVFADNERGLFSLLVKQRTKGFYGHFMWLIGPNVLASQTLTFRLYELGEYADVCEMKFVYSEGWTSQQRFDLLSAIHQDLKKPWYKRMYDIPGVVLRLFGLKWNIGKAYFCSERGSYLKMVDPEYDLVSPTPSDLNIWTKARQDRYSVYGRYFPD